MRISNFHFCRARRLHKNSVRTLRRAGTSEGAREFRPDLGHLA